LNRLVILDTNVLVSAGLSQGPPAHLVDLTLRRELSMILCPGILREYLEVMHRPKFTQAGFPPGWLDRLLGLAARLPLDPMPWMVPLPDPKDAVFLGLAKLSGATLVTGNLRHFPVDARRGVKVHSPTEFLSRLAGSES
jgi:putative PIN family toxin of toxin-antitoxin system